MNWWDENDQEYNNIYQQIGGRSGKSLGKDGPHVPNKNERKKLAEIKRTTGLTEEEIRADKTHRKALADARKMGTISKEERAKQRVWDEVELEMGKDFNKNSREAQQLFSELWSKEKKRKKHW